MDAPKAVELTSDTAAPSTVATDESGNTNTFRPNVFKYIKANAKPQMALKLMKTCKYFQHKKFPFFVVKSITCYDGAFYYTTLDGAAHEWNGSDEIPSNLWITQSISTDLPAEYAFISRLVPKIAVCEIQKLILEDEYISFNDFKVLTDSRNVTDIMLQRTLVQGNNGQMVSFDQILACLPNIKNIYLEARIPTFGPTQVVPSTLKSLQLVRVPNDYNVEAFIDFMKKNKKIEFGFRCNEPFIYPPDTNRLQAYVDEIVKAGDLQYPPPLITFVGQTQVSKNALLDFQKDFYKK